MTLAAQSRLGRKRAIVEWMMERRRFGGELGYDTAMMRKRAVALLVLVGSGVGCKERSADPPTTSPDTVTTDRRASSADPQCPGGGPSVSLNIRGRAGGDDLADAELAGLLGWIGGFVQPCISEPSRAHHITLVFHFSGPQGPAPTYEFVERQTLPTMAACLDEGFAQTSRPAFDPMTASIVVPWGCPTLGGAFRENGDPRGASPGPANTTSPL